MKGETTFSQQKNPHPSSHKGGCILLMISINIKGKSVNTLKESYYQATALWSGVCPICQRHYQHYGTYSRITPYLFGPISIQRVYCNSCKKSHALLPCFIIPYARVLDVIREAAIIGISFNTQTIEELAELLDVDPTTVARWWRIFRTKSGVLMESLTKKLAQSPQLSDWTSGPLHTPHERTKKILELISRCKNFFSPGFAFCGLAWVNIHNPYLLFTHKGHDKNTGV